ncbi:MAG: NusG domain II-containing protein [Bacilli bacterium]|nr:NusG domain II-containing protein [Bacilli bacterium]
MKHLWDFLLLGVLLVGTASIYVGRTLINNKNANQDVIATVLYEGNVMEIIDEDGKKLNPFDLGKVTDYKEIEIQGRHTTLTIGLKHNSIAVVKSGCPGQECVHEKWVSKANHPIVCAHNGIYIEIKTDNWSDVIIG